MFLLGSQLLEMASEVRKLMDKVSPLFGKLWRPFGSMLMLDCCPNIHWDLGIKMLHMIWEKSIAFFSLEMEAENIPIRYKKIVHVIHYGSDGMHVVTGGG
ncbi:hypothetical protein L6452_34824 [Arctium lappa]|uniref:Uncharacterized protein n=1 Tax=Arctium lappa TaxID=4217 RepID=A0ACB8YK07_ARCLA|nr:hypothetical protein L6452_34824 [Arctium lappa]